jgi:NAD(P)-dependent dehydrogenase (short-subunit alcohol dehydrogenase family)
MTQRFLDKVVVVTGGATGIGFAATQRFASEGARVYITERRDAELTKAAAALGSNAAVVVGNTSKLDDLDRLCDRIKKEVGKIDVVLANAGGSEMSPLGTITQAPFRRYLWPQCKGHAVYHAKSTSAFWWMAAQLF